MHIIPVLDLKDGLVVHAVAGQRSAYRPIRSVLVDTPEPVAVLQALHDRLGCDEFYVADLDAIQGQGNHNRLIARLSSQPGVKLWVDAGCTTVQAIQQLLSLGIARAILGTETLPAWQVAHDVLVAVPGECLVLSLDMRAGRVLSRDLELAQLAPLEVLGQMSREGGRDVILLDLARVGTAHGPDLNLLESAVRRFPDMRLIAGGGVRDSADLAALQAIGVAGVLVATALHRGLVP